MGMRFHIPFFGNYDPRWDSGGDRISWGWAICLFGAVAINSSLSVYNYGFDNGASEWWMPYLKRAVFLMPEPVNEFSPSDGWRLIAALVIFPTMFRLISSLQWSLSAVGSVVRRALIFCVVGVGMQAAILSGDDFPYDWKYWAAMWALLMAMYARK